MDTLRKAVPAFLLTIGLIFLGWFIYCGINNLAYRDRQVMVRGLAEREVKANKVTWPLVVKTLGNDLQQLYSQINNNNAIVLKFLKDNGITDKEISVNAPNVFDKDAQTYQANTPYRYNVTEVITVTTNKVDKVNELIKRQVELMRQGVALSSDYENKTIYEYTDLNRIKPSMIADATKNARQAADKFADDSNSDVGRIKSASQGQFTIEDRDSYTPWVKKIRVVTSVTYYLNE